MDRKVIRQRRVGFSWTGLDIRSRWVPAFRGREVITHHFITHLLHRDIAEQRERDWNLATSEHDGQQNLATSICIGTYYVQDSCYVPK